MAVQSALTLWARLVGYACFFYPAQFFLWTTPNTCQYKCNVTGGYAWNGTVCALRNSLASDTSGWSSSSSGPGGTTCPTCIYNSYVKNLGVMSLLQFWRWRVNATYSATSVQHSTHVETLASAGSTYCGLIKQIGANVNSNDGGGSYATTSITESAPWAVGTANGYTYHVYRAVTANAYNCSLFLRVNGLNMYGKGAQSMLSGLNQTMTNGISGLCSHGNCGDTYGYLSGKVQSDLSGDNTSAIADGYCYGYTIYK